MMPCLQCLEDIKHGEPYLILAHRPFPAAQPYAEQAPIFSCMPTHVCGTPRRRMPCTFLKREAYLIGGHSAQDGPAHLPRSAGQLHSCAFSQQQLLPVSHQSSIRRDAKTQIAGPAQRRAPRGNFAQTARRPLPDRRRVISRSISSVNRPPWLAR